MGKPVCAIIGVGPGNGEAYAQRFADQGHAVALLSRSVDTLHDLAARLPDARAVACDASQPERVAEALAEVARELGPVQTLIYNAGSGVFGSIDDVDLDAFDTAWRVNTLGLAAAAKAVIPGMREVGSGNIIVTGATASRKGGANFAAFAQAKAAQRSLAQSLARKLGPDGIHVALIVIDAVVDLPRTRQAMADRAEHEFAKPHAIADAAWFLASQDRSAWTFELDLRPFCENW